ncbi:MAG: hypothetical protein V1690_02835 [Candidatus Moraniibacteriota bacterium]
MKKRKFLLTLTVMFSLLAAMVFAATSTFAVTQTDPLGKVNVTLITSAPAVNHADQVTMTRKTESQKVEVIQTVSIATEGTTLFAATNPAGIGSGVTVLTGKDSLLYKDHGRVLLVIVSGQQNYVIGTAPTPAPTPVIGSQTKNEATARIAIAGREELKC